MLTITESAIQSSGRVLREKEKDEVRDRGAREEVGDVSGGALQGNARFRSGWTTRNAGLEYKVLLVENTTLSGKQ